MPVKWSRGSWRLFVVAALLLGAVLLATWVGFRRSPSSLGIMAYARADWETAAEQARSRLKVEPNDREALRLLARASSRRGRDNTAEGIYRRLGASAMEPEDLFLLGRALLRQGRIEPGLAALGAARDADPDHAETLNELTRYWSESGSLVEAEKAASRLAAQPGWEVQGGVWLGHLRSQLFDSAGAASALAEALKQDPHLSQAKMSAAEARRLLTRCLLESGRAVEAQAQLLTDGNTPVDPETSWLLSRALLQDGKAREAETALKSAQGFRRDDPMHPEPSPFVGSKACAECHPRQFTSQQQSGHARTLTHTSQITSLPWPTQAITDPAHHEVSHHFSRIHGTVEVATKTERQTFHALVAYALGSNHQGQTFLGKEEQGQYRELRLSRYPGEPHWDRTIEHPLNPPDEAGYLGRPISAESLRRCLHCHATNFRAVQEPAGRSEANDRGIGCERCHGPGGNHLRAMADKFSEPAIARPKLASAARVVELCAECHKAPASANPNDPGFIRFQAPNFVKSRCYTESGKSFSCVTCHNPHQNAERKPAHYESTCLSCHRATQDPTAKNEHITASSCPVNSTKDCLRCHMPRVSNAVPRSVFTDHFIRKNAGSRNP